MSISERIEGTIENWRVKWQKTLKEWFASWVMDGIVRVMDFLEPDLRAEIKPSLLRIRDIPGLPEDFISLIDKTLEEPKAIHLAAILPYLVGILIGLGMGAAAPAARMGSYQIDRLMRSARLDPITAFRALWRGFITEDHLTDSLKDQGWSDVDLETLRNVLKFYPAPPDLIRWQAREVFEPEMIARYGLDSEFEAIEKEAFYKAGMTDEQILNYWRAHWEHASWMQVVEMLHRGLLTEEQVYDWFRVVEIPPFWRDLLIQTAYTWPTRVDVRRWWDMRTIDETELRRLYSGMGYRGVNLDNYVLWTKVYVAFPDLMARWSKGWITLDDVKRELTALGMPAERLEEFIQMKVKAEQPERTAGERDITKTDIIKGVKQGVITRDEGVELLLDMGYDEDEAVYILEINIPRDQEDVVVKQRELTKADILKGLKAEVITETEAIDKIVGLRYRREDAEFLLKIFKALIKPPTEPREREASKADIIAAVKMGLITPEDAYLMLLDVGFTPEASEFILAVRAEVSPFSPINFPEFKDLTQKYRVAIGREAKPMPEELKKASEEVVRLTGEVKALELSIAEEKRGLIAEEEIPAAVTKRLKGLQVKRNRAISELERVKSEYDRLVAEWRHG